MLEQKHIEQGLFAVVLSLVSVSNGGGQQLLEVEDLVVARFQPSLLNLDGKQKRLLHFFHSLLE